MFLLQERLTPTPNTNTTTIHKGKKLSYENTMVTKVKKKCRECEESLFKEAFSGQICEYIAVALLTKSLLIINFTENIPFYFVNLNEMPPKID